MVPIWFLVFWNKNFRNSFCYDHGKINGTVVTFFFHARTVFRWDRSYKTDFVVNNKSSDKLPFTVLEIFRIYNEIKFCKISHEWDSYRPLCKGRHFGPPKWVLACLTGFQTGFKQVSKGSIRSLVFVFLRHLADIQATRQHEDIACRKTSIPRLIRYRLTIHCEDLENLLVLG